MRLPIGSRRRRRCAGEPIGAAEGRMQIAAEPPVGGVYAVSPLFGPVPLDRGELPLPGDQRERQTGERRGERPAAISEKR